MNHKTRFWTFKLQNYRFTSKLLTSPIHMESALTDTNKEDGDNKEGQQNEWDEDNSGSIKP